MVSESQPSCDIRCMVITLTKAQKRWRLAYFSIKFSNIISSSTRKDSKKIRNYPISRITSPPLHTTERFSSINQTELKDLMKRKDLKILHKLNGVQGLAKSLHTTLEHGIISHDIESRKTAFGSNTYKKRPQKKFVHFVMEAVNTTFSLLLLCAIICLGFSIRDNGAKEGWYEGGSIFVAVFLAITIYAVSNFRQERQFNRLSKISNDIKVDAIREGRIQKISIFDVVVGDVIILNIGDRVPADGLFVNGHSLLIDKSSITGESDHINVDAMKNPFLFSGSKVADGHAQMLVISVGMNTARGNMMNSVTPIQSCLNKAASSFAKVGLAALLLDLMITLIRYFTGYTKDKYGNWDYRGKCTDTNDILNSFTRAVVATTEGLPLAVILTLFYCLKRMMFENVMVRKLSACEMMGSVTVICTNKTGTLTLNQMEVTKFCVGHDPIEHNSLVDAKILELYHQGISLNTTGSVYNSGSTCEYSGSPTEKAILSWAVTNLGMDVEKLKQDNTVLHVETFNSEKKRSGVLVKRKEDDTIHVHWKGVAEMVLAMCANYYQKDGLVKSINHEERSQFENIIQSMAASSLRCIAFAHKEDGAACKTLNVEGLTLLGIIGIKNPCRQGAKEAIETCMSAGVEIKMITGDNVLTAKALATDCGILKAGDKVIEGEEFRSYTDEERMENIDSIKVMARSSPCDKLLFVQCLKKKSHVVAITGHDTNDALAMKEADIGISMRILNSEVATESSDIVILNDGFGSVVMALKWGRCVQINIQKFIQFQLTANLVVLVINFVKAASAGGVPLIPIQQLWVNLVVNTFGALALASEGPTKELMHKPPVAKGAPLITNIMWRNLLAQSLYQIVVLLTFEFRGKSIFKVNESVKKTIIFNTFVLCQALNLFNSRKLEKRNIFEDLHKNWFFIGVFTVTVVLQIVMVEFLHSFADTEKLNTEQWGICIVIAALSWPVGWFVKMIPVPKTPLLSYIKDG